MRWNYLSQELPLNAIVYVGSIFKSTAGSFAVQHRRSFAHRNIICGPIGPLQDPVTWYGINYTGTQMTQWNFQNKGKSGWTGKSSFVLKVPLRHLRPSVIYSVPFDRILQRAYLGIISGLRINEY